jgi:hypothetical protein
VADSLQEAGDRLFTFTRLPPSQRKSARTTDEMDKRFLHGRDDCGDRCKSILIWGFTSQALDLRHGLLSSFLPRGFFVRA